MATHDWNFNGITPKPWDNIKDLNHCVTGRVYRSGEDYVYLDRSDNRLKTATTWQECYNYGLKHYELTEPYYGTLNQIKPGQQLAFSI